MASNSPKKMVPPAETLQPSVVVCTSAVVEPVMKKCSKCKKELEISFFTKSGNGRKRSDCKKCVAAYRKIHNKENKPKIDAYNKMYGSKNRKALNARTAKYCVDNKDEIRRKRHEKYWANWEEMREKNKVWRLSKKEELNEQSRNYYAANSDRKRFLAKERRKNDVQFRIVGCLRSRLYLVLIGKLKSASTKKLIGCDIPFLIAHLEKQFTKDMNWGNYGSFWSLDHRKPCSSFDLTNPEDQKKCFNWSNLQPLPITENSSKGAKIDPKYNNQS